MALSRRELIERCLSTGALMLASSALAERAMALADPAPKLHPTPENELGPFYKKGAPATASLVAPGDPGFPLVVSGRVVDVGGTPLPDAVVEIWQTDHRGIYDLSGYRYRARLVPGKTGEYRFETVVPGHYPGRIAQHIHYRVTAPGKKVLVTQLYFATDPVFGGDPDHNYQKDPLVESRELVRPVTLTVTKDVTTAVVTFDSVLASR